MTDNVRKRCPYSLWQTAGHLKRIVHKFPTSRVPPLQIRGKMPPEDRGKLYSNHRTRKTLSRPQNHLLFANMTANWRFVPRRNAPTGKTDWRTGVHERTNITQKKRKTAIFLLLQKCEFSHRKTLMLLLPVAGENLTGRFQHTCRAFSTGFMTVRRRRAQ